MYCTNMFTGPYSFALLKRHCVVYHVSIEKDGRTFVNCFFGIQIYTLIN